MVRSLALLAALALFIGLSAGAEGLAPSAHQPAADGVVVAGEYGQTRSYAGMRLSSSLSSDGSTLYLALEAPTTGWLAIGIGSSLMDGSFMVLAYSAKDAEVISEQTGVGNSHRPTAVKRLTSSAVRESGGSTTLELGLPAAELGKASTLKLILAWGASDSLGSIHSKYSNAEIAIAKR